MLQPQTYFCRIPSPMGVLLLVGDGKTLQAIDFEPSQSQSHWIEDPQPFAAAAAQLKEYFAGKRRIFDLPLAPRGTPFQKAVWTALLDVTYGETASYGDIARRIGRPKAVRAVGAANGQNPLPIVIPCHRVIGANGSLTGYGGGLWIKEKLLALERAQQPLL